MWSEVGRVAGDNLANMFEYLLTGTGCSGGEDHFSELFWRWEVRPSAREPFLRARLVRFCAGGRLLEHSPNPFSVVLDVLRGKSTALGEEVSVLSEWSELVFDCLVHARLSEHWLIGLIMAVSAVADDIDHDVLLELGSPVGCQLANECDGFDVIAVDMEDGCIDGFGDIRAVGRRTGEAWICRETDLVIDD